MTYTFSTGSGYLNSPPRVVLIGDDNRPGSYPVEVSPVLAAKSLEYAKPYRDNIFPDTRSPYAQARVVFNDVPNEGETIVLTNAKSQAQTFTFKRASSVFQTGPAAYNVSYDTLTSAPREGEESLTRRQVIIKRAVEKFVQAVNDATGSLITASITAQYNRVMLAQRIPGTAGNVSNSTTSAKVSIQNFTGGNAGEIRYPFGIIASGSGEVLRRVLSTAESGTLDVPAAGNASLLTAYSDGHPYAVFQPYDESNSHQAFGIATGGSSEYGTQASLTDEFFTRGSVSGSLDEPLGTKDKIVIDLEPTEKTTLQFVNKAGGTWPSVAENYPMAYFNHISKKWERIGLGVDPNNFVYSTVSTQNQLKSHMVGFSQNYLSTSSYVSINDIKIVDNSDGKFADGNKRIFSETSWGSCVDTFGFPSHAHFHATSSQQFPASTIIERPFIVEKIVYEFSASCNTAVNFANGKLKSGGATFFILNQRKAGPERSTQSTAVNVSQLNTFPGSNQYLPPPSSTGSNDSLIFSLTSSIPENVFLTREDYNASKLTRVDTVRDIVTFSRIGAISSSYYSEISNTFYNWAPHPALFMDLALEVEDGGTYDGQFSIVDTVKSPTFNAALGSTFLYTSVNQRIPYVYTSKTSTTRNSYSIPTGRSYRNDQAAAKLIFETKVINDAAPRTIANSRVYGVESDTLNSPYILFPSDNLVFGWQSSFPQRIQADATGEEFSIGPGAGKLILYGSYLQDDKPVHDIYKDQLNSDAAHETLPTGPWVLDRFETEPQMCYSGSMREEHVTGTMVTRNATGGLTVTDVNDFSIGGVRSVSARVSNGNVRQRWSLFRNSRLIDSEEQYYDSMQPNPVDMLFYGNTRALLRPPINSSSPPYTIIPIMVPGEVYHAAPAAEWPLAPIPINLWFANDFPQWISAVNAYSNRNIWDGSFPFEAKYSSIPRIKKIGAKILAGENRPYFSYPQVYYGAGVNGPTIAGTAPNMKVVDINAGFGAAHVGRIIRISGATTPGNNGSFAITSVTATEAFYTNAAGVAEGPSVNLSYAVPTLEIPGTIKLGLRPVDGGIMFFTGSLNGTGCPSVLYSPGGLFEKDVPEPYGGIIPVSDYQALFPFTRFDIDTNPVFPNRLVGSSDGNKEGINYEWSRFMGCFGSGYRQMIQYGNIAYAFPPYFYPNSLTYGALYRGVKHGLINPTPLFSNAIFNGTQFGQFRDMMEQRQYTRFSLADNTLTEAAVSVQFINRSAPAGTLNITSGSATNSSNISKFVTSEHPYDDALADLDQIWDRNTALPETLIAL